MIKGELLVSWSRERRGIRGFDCEVPSLCFWGGWGWCLFRLGLCDRLDRHVYAKWEKERFGWGIKVVS